MVVQIHKRTVIIVEKSNSNSRETALRDDGQASTFFLDFQGCWGKVNSFLVTKIAP